MNILKYRQQLVDSSPWSIKTRTCRLSSSEASVTSLFGQYNNGIILLEIRITLVWTDDR